MIEECLSRYGPQEVCVSFNGGKDCSAMLHIIYAAWKKIHPTDGLRLRAIYIRGQDPFPEMERFVEETRKRQRHFLHSFDPIGFFFKIVVGLFNDASIGETKDMSQYFKSKSRKSKTKKQNKKISVICLYFFSSLISF